MHFGVTLQHYREHASPEAIVEVAQAAEALGFDSVWVMDHVVVPEVPEAEQFTPLVYDPFVTLSYVAAKTERVRLGGASRQVCNFLRGAPSPCSL